MPRTTSNIRPGVQHPLYKLNIEDWQKWRLAYVGGKDFKDKFLERYSRKETPEDFRLRKQLTYVPAHARSVIDIIRNAIAIRLPDVVRDGDERYLNAMATNVDGFNNSMNTFVAIDIAPLLLVHGKRYVVVDAPPPAEGRTIAEDEGLPYFYTVSAEDVLSWSYDSSGNIKAIMMRLVRDIQDPTTRLVRGAEVLYRYMLRLEPGETFTDSECGQVQGPGVLIKDVNKMGKAMGKCQLMADWERVPVAEFKLADSVMGLIADHQIALLNLASTDMDFLFRGNFPLYTEQKPKSSGTIRPRGTKGEEYGPGVLESPDDESVDGHTPKSRKGEARRNMGIGKGVGYREGLDRPDFIAPSTDNLKASIVKQETVAKEIRILVDLALVSLSVHAIEQSGKSKEADRVGEEAGLAYIGRALESGERDLNELWHMMAGIDASQLDLQVNYPSGYSIKTQEQRLDEAEQMRKLRSAVRSEAYQKAMDQRIAEVVLKPVTTSEELAEILAEITEGTYFDDDKERANVVQRDVALRIISRGKASELRGYGEDEQANVAAESRGDLSLLASGAAEGAGGAFDGDEGDTEGEGEGEGETD